MPLAHHIVLTAYGFWLPNDPRGSGSTSVGSWDLFQHGGPTRLDDLSASVAHQPHDHQKRLAAKQSLQHPPVLWTGEQALTIAHSFRDTAAASNYQFHAFAILQDHIHLILADDESVSRRARSTCHSPTTPRTPRSPHRIAGHLRSLATRALREKHAWPTDRPVWGKRSWVTFLDTPEAVLTAIDYTNANPEKSNLPRQHWSFITPFIIDNAR